MNVKISNLETWYHYSDFHREINRGCRVCVFKMMTGFMTKKERQNE